MKKKNILFILPVLITFFLQAVYSQALVKRSSFGMGGIVSSGPGVKLVGTIGQSIIGKNTSTNYVNESGFLASARMILVKDDIPEVIPGKFELFQNYPNPFNPVTNIRFGVPKASHVKLDVFNVLGQRVAILVDSKMEPGYQVIKFDASSLASGFYIYRFQAGDFIKYKKMILIE